MNFRLRTPVRSRERQCPLFCLYRTWARVWNGPLKFLSARQHKPQPKAPLLSAIQRLCSASSSWAPVAPANPRCPSGLGLRLGHPVVELDQVFWRAGLEPMPRDEWSPVQRGLVEPDRWILDGDLGPYEELEVPLTTPDIVIVLDFRGGGAHGGHCGAAVSNSTTGAGC